MPNTILVNGLSIIHKNSGAVAKATLPNVCLTPGPNGPAAINYPNTAYSKDLVGGSATIRAGGEHMCAVKGSRFSQSQGDEPGTLGGMLSGTHMGPASWLTYSANVLFEGRNVCRFTDKMIMNNGNTACAAGVWNPQRADADQADINATLKKKIADAVNGNQQAAPKSKAKARPGLKEIFSEQGPGASLTSSQIEEKQANLLRSLKKMEANVFQDPAEGAWSLLRRPVPDKLNCARFSPEARAGNKTIDFPESVKMPEPLPGDYMVP